MAKKMVNTICPDCGGTGLYRGFMEAANEYVVCIPCGGTGGIKYPLFTGRKPIKDTRSKISFRASRSIAILGNSEKFSYKEFLKKIPELV